MRVIEQNAVLFAGMHVLGRPGRIWGNTIQLAGFFLYLPCALRFCALSLAGIGMGIPGPPEQIGSDRIRPPSSRTTGGALGRLPLCTPYGFKGFLGLSWA